MLREDRAFQNSNVPERGAAPGSSPGWTGSLALAALIGLCLLVGASAGVITQASVHTWYHTLARPPLAPPDWVFGPVWTALYVLMAVAAWLVWRRAGAGRALRLWGWQLLANALWTPAFFGLHSPALALGVIAVLIALLVATIRAFAPVCRLAALLMLPYLAWVCFAAYLNAGFWWLN